MRRALLCLALLAACRQPVELEPPTSVFSTLGPVPIYYVDTIRGVDSTRYLVGGYDYYARRILIRREALRNPVTAWLIGLHEECHVFLVDAGIKADSPVVELICDSYAKHRMAELLSQRKR